MNLTFLMEMQVSFRFHQMNVSQWDFSKGFGKKVVLMLPLIMLDTFYCSDNTTPIGPCLVAASSISDPQNLTLRTVVNGQVLQDGTTA
jgi:hypothetical protein